MLYIADGYDPLQDFCAVAPLLAVAAASLSGLLAAIVASYILWGNALSPSALVLHGVIFALLLCLWRYSFSVLLFNPAFFRRTMIVGAGGAGRRMVQVIRDYPRSGLLPVGFVDDDPGKVGTVVNGLPVWGPSSRLPELIRREQVTLIIVAITHQKETDLLNQLIKSCWQGCTVTDMPTIFEAITGKVPTSHISSEWLYQWNVNASRLYYRHLKRVFDLVLASCCFLATLPLFLLIALAIKLESPGPVFFYQERLGQDHRPFRIIKFRTMFQGNGEEGPIWTEKDDARLTRVGRFIRRVRLDELPQFLNIFRGDMSFIGPRPLVHSDYKESVPYYNYRFLVRPGITGWAQVSFPHGLAEEDLLEKVKYDIYYIKNLSFLLDVAIFLKTIRVVLLGQGH
jgi:exopolysaccharide biosynthesis polyprenyl glycosylphosphotransferase